MGVNLVLLGALAMASFIAALFFFKFWRDTKDRFFLFFAVGFSVEALTRLAASYQSIAGEDEPLIYLGRLVTFLLIGVAIAEKNCAKR